MMMSLADPAFIAHKSVPGNPTHRASTGGSTTATTLNVTKPSGVLPNDRLVLSVGFNDGGITTRKPTPPSGSAWEIVDGPNPTRESANAMVMGVYEAWSRDIDDDDLNGWSNDGTSVLWAWSMHAVKDVNQAIANDVAGLVDPDTSLNAQISCPALTTVTDNSLIIAIGIDVLQGGNASWGGGPTEIFDRATAGAWTHSAGAYNKTPAGATGIPFFTRTGANGRGVGATVALRPAA